MISWSSQDAKSDRVKQLLKETEKYLQKLGSKLQEAKSMARRFETDMDENRATNIFEKNEFTFENEDETDQAKVYSSLCFYGYHFLVGPVFLEYLMTPYFDMILQHYLESNEKYYMMAHR